ncbi:MAG: hydroxyacylglutathione hydrolase [Prochlorococcaceae cyanobacterium]
MTQAETIPAGGPEFSVSLIPVLNDNYVFLLQRGGQAAVVDPAVAEQVAAELERRGLELVAILHTHHHSDHIGGAAGLLRRWPAAAVLASAADRARIPHQSQGLSDGDRFTLLGQEVEVLAVPGHTAHHIAFHFPESGELFCGDTLFAAGCGRLFEGTAEQMHDSLQRLAALPPATRVWCAHEYTEANLRWAANEAPGDAAIAARLTAVRAARAAGKPTIPSTIGAERATNLFVRATGSAELARLRQSKNRA